MFSSLILVDLKDSSQKKKEQRTGTSCLSLCYFLLNPLAETIKIITSKDN